MLGVALVWADYAFILSTWLIIIEVARWTRSEPHHVVVLVALRARLLEFNETAGQVNILWHVVTVHIDQLGKVVVWHTNVVASSSEECV